MDNAAGQQGGDTDRENPRFHKRPEDNPPLGFFITEDQEFFTIYAVPPSGPSDAGSFDAEDEGTYNTPVCSWEWEKIKKDLLDRGTVLVLRPTESGHSSILSLDPEQSDSERSTVDSSDSTEESVAPKSMCMCLSELHLRPLWSESQQKVILSNDKSDVNCLHIGFMSHGELSQLLPTIKDRLLLLPMHFKPEERIIGFKVIHVEIKEQKLAIRPPEGAFIYLTDLPMAAGIDILKCLKPVLKAIAHERAEWMLLKVGQGAAAAESAGPLHQPQLSPYCSTRTFELVVKHETTLKLCPPSHTRRHPHRNRALTAAVAEVIQAPPSTLGLKSMPGKMMRRLENIKLASSTPVQHSPSSEHMMPKGINAELGQVINLSSKAKKSRGKGKITTKVAVPVKKMLPYVGPNERVPHMFTLEEMGLGHLTSYN